MVHNGILMETIGISVTFSFGLLLFFVFLAGECTQLNYIFTPLHNFAKLQLKGEGNYICYKLKVYVKGKTTK